VGHAPPRVTVCARCGIARPGEAPCGHDDAPRLSWTSERDDLAFVLFGGPLAVLMFVGMFPGLILVLLDTLGAAVAPLPFYASLRADFRAVSHRGVLLAVFAALVVAEAIAVRAWTRCLRSPRRTHRGAFEDLAAAHVESGGGEVWGYGWLRESRPVEVQGAPIDSSHVRGGAGHDAGEVGEVIAAALAGLVHSGAIAVRGHCRTQWARFPSGPRATPSTSLELEVASIGAATSEFEFSGSRLRRIPELRAERLLLDHLPPAEAPSTEAYREPPAERALVWIPLYDAIAGIAATKLLDRAAEGAVSDAFGRWAKAQTDVVDAVRACVERRLSND